MENQNAYAWYIDEQRQPINPEMFMERATGVGVDTKENRKYLFHKTVHILRHVNCAHVIGTSFIILEGILESQHIPGPIVECGSFKGGMTAVMSHAAKLTEKKLYVYDSFEGLPKAEEYNIIKKYKYHKQWQNQTNGFFEKGGFAGSVDEVKWALNNYGEINHVELVKGWFSDTLKNGVSYKPSFVFIDVDIISSMRECMECFWPILQGQKFFTHEASMKDYTDALLDEEWWRNKFDQRPPMFFGRGGLPEDPALGFLVKE